MTRRLWKLDGKVLDNRKYITVKVKIPVGTAKNIVSARKVNIIYYELKGNVSIQIGEQLERRLKFETVKTYAIDDIRVGLVYEFKDAKRNRYMIAAIDQSSIHGRMPPPYGLDYVKQVITQRLNDNNAGKTGELITSDTEKILTYLNDDMAVVIGYAPNYEQALMLP